MSDPSRTPPPVQPPSLPHTWRPLGALIAVLVFGTALVVLCGVVWFALDPGDRAQFTILQRVTLLVLMAMFLGCYHALVRSRVVATDEGVRVVNGYRTRRYEWSQILNVSMGRGAPWGTLDLSDGTTQSMVGIQSSDGLRARRAIRELRVLLAQHSPS